MFRAAHYEIVGRESTPEVLVIRDCSSLPVEGDYRFEARPSVTNDAERVVKQLVAGGLLPPGRRLAYYDTEGQLDEIIVEDGQFAGFAVYERA